MKNLKNKIAFIVCDNGYGHITRILLIAKYFHINNYKCTLFCNPAKIKFLLKKSELKNYIIKKNLDFKLYNLYTKDKIAKLKKNKNLLLDYDYVVSDNLIEILELRKDLILSGSFFWHKVKSNKITYYKYCENLLEINQPITISNTIFSPKYLKQRKNNYKINLLHKYFNKKIKSNYKTDLLISIGESSELFKSTKKFVKQLINNKENYNLPFRKIWIEKKLLPKKYPNFIVPARYNHVMFSRLIACIIRPGIGTISEALKYKIKIFCFFENNNTEIFLNSSIIQKLGYGTASVDINKSFKDSIKYATNKKQTNQFRNNLKKIKFDGAIGFYNIITKKI